MPNTQRDRLIIPVAAIVLIGWFGSLGDAIVTRDLGPITYTTPLMVALAGYVFGVQLVRKSNGS